MGAGNVLRVFEQWYRLPDLPLRVLLYMAVRSLDHDKPPIYKAGWEKLAHAAGRDVPLKGVPRKEWKGQPLELRRAQRASEKSVADAVRVLVSHGAVEVQVPGAPGRPAIYALVLPETTLHGERDGSTATLHGERDVNASRSAANALRPADQRITLSVPTHHGERDAQEYEEEKEEEGGGARQEPPLRCPRHLEEPTTDPCRGCGDARKAHEAWQHDQADAEEAWRAEHRAFLAFVATQPPCIDETPGGDIRKPGTTWSVCPHCRTRAEQPRLAVVR